jgi:hypothetical protein
MLGFCRDSYHRWEHLSSASTIHCGQWRFQRPSSEEDDWGTDRQLRFMSVFRSPGKNGAQYRYRGPMDSRIMFSCRSKSIPGQAKLSEPTIARVTGWKSEHFGRRSRSRLNLHTPKTILYSEQLRERLVTCKAILQS